MQNKRKRIKDKLKKTIALAVIANILLSLFCLSSFAINYPHSLTIEKGTTLVFKDNISELTEDIYIDYNVKNVGDIKNRIRKISNELRFIGDYSLTAYSYSTSEWANNFYKTITINSDYTTSNSNIIQWFYDNIQSGLPDTPGPLESAKDFYNTSLNFGTILISFITANAITIIPIILFVFIALLGCGIALIKRK